MAEARIGVIVADREGRYVDASEVALDSLGYSLDELRALPIGTLSARVEPGVSAAVWRKFVAGEIDFPPNRPLDLRRRDGSIAAATLVSIGPAAQPDRWDIVVRFDRTPEDQARPGALHVLLEEWLEAQRHLAAMAADDPGRAAQAAEVERLRALYAAESTGRGEPA